MVIMSSVFEDLGESAVVFTIITVCYTRSRRRKKLEVTIIPKDGFALPFASISPRVASGDPDIHGEIEQIQAVLLKHCRLLAIHGEAFGSWI